MILLPNSPQIQFAENFNATTSVVNFGVRPEQFPGAQTCCAVVFPIGAGELGTNTIMNVTDSASNNGPRLRFADSGGWLISFNGSSSGSTGNPSRFTTFALNYSQWHFVAATWDGALAATGIRMYYAVENRALVEGAYGTTTDGVTAVDYGNGKALCVGNRPDAGRTYNGNLGYVARWSRELTPQELALVQRRGPLALTDGLILCYANGRDYGPFQGKVVSKAAVGLRAPPTARYPLGSLLPQRLLVAVPATNTQPPRSMHQFRQRAA